MRASTNRPLTENERKWLREQVTTSHQMQNMQTHTILWFNLPDYVPLKKWNKKFKDCLYANCNFTANRTMLRSSSAIIFVTSTAGMGESPPLTAYERAANQVWIFMSMESPVNHQWVSDFRSPLWEGTMNWSMTYRVDSDILIPYGFLTTRNIVPKRNYSETFRRKTKFAAWIVSNCDTESKRDKFVSRLQDLGIPIDVYGKCGFPLEKDPATMINQTYKFYFSLENSLCKDYVTEKFFSYFSLDTVLVVRGGANYEQLLPSGTFIDSSQFSSLSQLAKHLTTVNSSEELYTKYLREKDKYQTKTTFKDPSNLPFCELCSKLNNKASNQRVYQNILDSVYTDACEEPSDLREDRILIVVCIVLFISVLFCVICIFLKARLFHQLLYRRWYI